MCYAGSDELEVTLYLPCHLRERENWVEGADIYPAFLDGSAVAGNIYLNLMLHILPPSS